MVASSLQKEKLLIIVESPNKVKTISDILKHAGFDNVTVVASVGHIMTLGDGGSTYNSGIYPKQNYKMNLFVADDKKKISNNITNLAQVADKIYIMTDGDREGEVIAWSLIKFCKLAQEKCFRIITHEITPKAILKAIEHPTTLNNNLVNAGLVRMMVDKLIGYGLSPLGKKYIGAKSIGRCQSVGLKLISDREKEISNFIPELYFNLYLNFDKDGIPLCAKYFGYKDTILERFNTQADVDAVITDCKGHDFIVESIDEVLHQESTKPPFTTATFQQEASSKLGLSVKNAMKGAQKLFEGININGKHRGLITYIRTDSTELSPEFLPELKTFIETNYGKNSFVTPKKAKRKKSDQNGHEALRVIDPSLTPDLLAKYTNNDFLIKIYKLIWQRTIASAMPNAIIAETVYKINNNQHKFVFSTKKTNRLGFKIVFEPKNEQLIQPCLTIGEKINQPNLNFEKKFTQSKPRYTEASLVKELQQKEIGRPSTYVSIVETLLSPTRNYAKLENRYIVPTDRGMQLADYCNRSLDKIAIGKINWADYMDIFYNDLVKIINDVNEVGMASEMPDKLCPNCGKAMVIRRSRFGRLFYGCSTYPKCNGIIGID